MTDKYLMLYMFMEIFSGIIRLPMSNKLETFLPLLYKTLMTFYHSLVNASIASAALFIASTTSSSRANCRLSPCHKSQK